jgi:hypothetical protein
LAASRSGEYRLNIYKFTASEIYRDVGVAIATCRNDFGYFGPSTLSADKQPSGAIGQAAKAADTGDAAEKPDRPTLPQVPGIDDRDAQILEIGHVAGDDGFAMHRRRGGDERVGHILRPHGGYSAPFQGDLVADRQNSPRVVHAKLLQPAIKG